MSLSPTPTRQMHKHACSLCARRKVKCDKGDPCSNCIKAESTCLYEASAPYRPRKRAADEDLLTRLSQYEDLMRKHNIDFSHYANTWILCDQKLPSGHSNAQSPVYGKPTTCRLKSQEYPTRDNTADAERCLWSTLSPELKRPYIQDLTRNGEPSSPPTPSLRSLFDNGHPELRKLHPDPRSILRLWQTFVDNVNPFTKIIHVPTLQQRILDASWDPSNASPSLTALLYAIYTLSVGLMPSEECHCSFGESRDTLVLRYRTATLWALIAADFLTTTDLEVMQALALHLLENPGADSTSTLVAAAIRLCQRMEMDNENARGKISPFDRELRISLWWQLRGLDCRSRAACTVEMESTLLSELCHIRLPLNVNDADLHPDMARTPTEHDGPTEMLCVLAKLEVFDHVRSLPAAAKIYPDVIRGSFRDKVSMELEHDVVNDLEARYEKRFLHKLDRNIPLHALTHVIVNLTIARLRFRIRHPRRLSNVYDTEVYMTQAESDSMFESALRVLELVHVGKRTKFSSHISTHMTFRIQVDAYIYILSDLRRRCSGDRVNLAWELVESFYNDYPELFEVNENAFYSALGELTLEAWQARKQELVSVKWTQMFDITPQFLRVLWNKLRSNNDQVIQAFTALEPHSLDGTRSMEGDFSDLDSWNDLFSF